jgi:hypothetical protein
MTTEVAKTIATSAVWICTAIILAGGLYRMHGQEDFFAFATFVIMSAATLATGFIWRRPRVDKSRGFDVVMPAQPVEKD